MTTLCIFHQSRPEQPEKLLNYLEDIQALLAPLGVTLQQQAVEGSLRPGADKSVVLDEYAAPIASLLSTEFVVREVISLGRHGEAKAAMVEQYSQEQRAGEQVWWMAAGYLQLNIHAGDCILALMLRRGDLLRMPTGLAFWLTFDEEPHVLAVHMSRQDEPVVVTGETWAQRVPAIYD